MKRHEEVEMNQPRCLADSSHPPDLPRFIRVAAQAPHSLRPSSERRVLCMHIHMVFRCIGAGRICGEG